MYGALHDGCVLLPHHHLAQCCYVGKPCLKPLNGGYISMVLILRGYNPLILRGIISYK